MSQAIINKAKFHAVYYTMCTRITGETLTKSEADEVELHFNMALDFLVEQENRLLKGLTNLADDMRQSYLQDQLKRGYLSVEGDFLAYYQDAFAHDGTFGSEFWMKKLPQKLQDYIKDVDNDEQLEVYRDELVDMLAAGLFMLSLKNMEK